MFVEPQMCTSSYVEYPRIFAKYHGWFVEVVEVIIVDLQKTTEDF